MRIICQLSESTNNLFPTHTTTFKENSLQAHPGSLTRSPHDHHLIRRLLSTRNHLYHRSSLPFYLFSLSSVMKIIKGLGKMYFIYGLYRFRRTRKKKKHVDDLALSIVVLFFLLLFLGKHFVVLPAIFIISGVRLLTLPPLPPRRSRDPGCQWRR